jgi:hypothetical protein
MSLPDVTREQILDALQHLPVERWSDALRAIEGLSSLPTSAAAAKTVRTGTDLRNSALIGIWSDRTDIANNHLFAREVRRQAEQRK